MKLQSIRDGTVYATEGRRVYREATEPLSFEPVGTLPIVERGRSALAERALTANPWKRAVTALVGSYQTANLWTLSGSRLLATAGRRVFASRDGGRSWRHTLTLPSSSGPMGVLPSNVCQCEGATYLAEYPLDESATPRVHKSVDGGESWRTHLELADVRHFHAVAVDPYGGGIWLTTGDRDDECRLLRLRDGEVRTVGGGSQDWRIVEPAFTRDAVVWGVDCGYADDNPIYRLPRSAFDDPSPTPERVATAASSVYYAETLSVDGTEWVVLATAAESGGDRTAGGAAVSGDGRARVLAASSETGFTDWTTLAAYRRRTTPADWSGDPPRLPTANAYVLLASCPDRGLFLNPYNTAEEDGAIRRIPLSAFRSGDGVEPPRTDLGPE